MKEFHVVVTYFTWSSVTSYVREERFRLKEKDFFWRKRLWTTEGKSLILALVQDVAKLMIITLSGDNQNKKKLSQYNVGFESEWRGTRVYLSDGNGVL
ncbi:hypothetical protein AVEN_238365-1 [Araneus ventricosus]|uniref:Uncharacterized protein n=1 Tax=Araneus ventricosus TaxID=182803 RepID=A0A4Y2LJ33_ARAVE|nr:hypothetical protein AVEN_238365-1 [Araneus ventricosus]